MSRVIRIDWDVYERLAQLSLVLDTWMPSDTLEAWMNLTVEEAAKIREELRGIPFVISMEGSSS